MAGNDDYALMFRGNQISRPSHRTTFATVLIGGQYVDAYDVVLVSLLFLLSAGGSPVSCCSPCSFISRNSHQP